MQNCENSLQNSAAACTSPSLSPIQYVTKYNKEGCVALYTRNYWLQSKDAMSYSAGAPQAMLAIKDISRVYGSE